MKVTATITDEDMKYFRRMMSAYEKEIGKTSHEVMAELGKAVAKDLAHSIQPVGLSSAVGKKFEQGIKKQAHRAVKNANVTGGSESALQAHSNRRDRRGRVFRDLATSGIFQRSPIELDDRFALATKKAENAGMAKGAWIAAGEAIDGKQISRIPKWIRRHAKRGDATVKLHSVGSDITITNKISYVSKVSMRGTIGQILRVAYRKQLKRMIISMNKKRNKI